MQLTGWSQQVALCGMQSPGTGEAPSDPQITLRSLIPVLYLYRAHSTCSVNKQMFMNLTDEALQRRYLQCG